MKAFLFQQLARYLTSVSFFQQCKNIVISLMDKDLSNEEKKATAVAMAKRNLVSFSNFAISLTIELALGYLKAKAGSI